MWPWWVMIPIEDLTDVTLEAVALNPEVNIQLLQRVICENLSSRLKESMERLMKQIISGFLTDCSSSCWSAVDALRKVCSPPVHTWNTTSSQLVPSCSLSSPTSTTSFLSILWSVKRNWIKSGTGTAMLSTVMGRWRRGPLEKRIPKYVFSVTRRSRSDSHHLLTYSLTYWVSVSTDLTDVTLVSDDTY